MFGDTIETYFGTQLICTFFPYNHMHMVLFGSDRDENVKVLLLLWLIVFRVDANQDHLQICIKFALVEKTSKRFALLPDNSSLFSAQATRQVIQKTLYFCNCARTRTNRYTCPRNTVLQREKSLLFRLGRSKLRIVPTRVVRSFNLLSYYCLLYKCWSVKNNERKVKLETNEERKSRQTECCTC